VLPQLPEGHELRYQALLTAQHPEPLPNVVAYATPEALEVAPIPFEDFRSMVAQIPQDVLLPVLSDLQARLWDIEVDVAKQLELAEEIFRGMPELDRLKHFVASGPGRKVIFSEQAFTLLQWVAIADCNEEPADSLDLEVGLQVQRCLFGVSSYLEIASKGAGLQKPERWLRHLTQNFAFNGHPVHGSAMARTWLILGRLQREANDLRPRVPLDNWFIEDYGLSLEQQLAFSFALFGRLSNQRGDDEYGSVIHRNELADIFAALRFTEDQCVAAEKLISAPLAWFREQLDGKSVAQLSWDQVPFMQRPLIRMSGGRYLLQSPRALNAWMIDGPYYRGLDSARLRGEKAVSDYTARVGKLTERYVVELTKSAHREPRLPGAGKVYGDKTYGPGHHSSDVTITYPHEVVLIEVSSHRLTLEGRRDGDPEALRHDLTEMIGRRPKQLRRCIDAIKPRERWRAATLRFELLEPKKVARFWPIIVTASPLHWSSLLEGFLEPSLQELKERPDVEALDALAIEDLEALLAITEQTGRRFADLLASKAAAVGPHGDIRTWLATDRSVPNVARPAYLDRALTEVMGITFDLLHIEPGDEDGHQAGSAA